jgi:DNA (cytosine-5)-methyltransferase 1
MSKPRLLDLFCCQGGAAMGYHRAGFDVVGVDIEPQPRYPFEFHQADALEYLAAHGHEFDAIHASPPCQRYSESTHPDYRDNHPDLIDPTRAALLALGKPFVIENVDGARFILRNPFVLCGTMFGLNLWRHRWFEFWPLTMIMTPPCNHTELPVLITGTTRRKPENGGRFEFSAEACRDASGLTWMTRKGMDEAIPPAYTTFIGKHLMAALAQEPIP